jgi:hypothetical protein
MGNGYLFESGSDIPAGKLIPFFCSDSLNEIPPVLFADRYLLCNREQVEILRQERLQLRSQLDALQVELRSYLDTNIHAVQVDYSNKGAIDFLKQQNQDTQELAMFQSNIREGHLKCMLHIEALNSDYNRVFDRPDLQKYPLQYLKLI